MPTTVQVRLQGISNLPEDVFVNTLHFWGGEGEIAPAVVDAEIEALYNDIPAGMVNSISDFLSGTISRAVPVQLRYYNVAVGSSSGAPFHEDTFVLGAAEAGTALPEEVAIVSSFVSTLPGEATIPNRRGRNYIGPLISSTLSGAGPSRPSTPARETILRAYQDLATALNLSTLPVNNNWITLSVQYTGAPPNRVVSGFARGRVLHGWVDNAWDTQRRRGVAPTARGLWTGPA